MYQVFDAVYPGSAAVGNVTLHIAGCISFTGQPPISYTGSFTITTAVGTLTETLQVRSAFRLLQKIRSSSAPSQRSQSRLERAPLREPRGIFSYPCRGTML